MPKNILVLTGSPRKNGNSDRLAAAFAKGALSAGHHVEVFAAARKQIDGCRACETCWSKGTPCSFEDDFNRELAPLLEKADALVFITPLYWFSFPAKLKAAIDKFYAYVAKRSKIPLKVKESQLLVCAADDDMGIFDGIIASHKEIAQYLKWENRGVLAVPGVGKMGDIEAGDALAKAEELGRSL